MKTFIKCKTYHKSMFKKVSNFAELGCNVYCVYKIIIYTFIITMGKSKNKSKSQ